MRSWFALLITLAITMICSNITAQYYINKLIDYNGSNSYSEGYMCMSDSHHIYVIGLLDDRMRGRSYPFIASHDYNGNIIYQDTLDFEGDYRRIRMRTRIPVRKNISQYYCVQRHYTGDSSYNYIFELDLKNGLISNYKTLNMEVFGIVEYMQYDGKNTLTMVTWLNPNDPDPDLPKEKIHIIELDTNFNIIKHLGIRDTVNSPNYIEKSENGSYHIIGSIYSDTFPYKSIFHMEVDSVGDILDFDNPYFNGNTDMRVLDDVFTVAKDQNNNWIFEFIHNKDSLKRQGRETTNSFPYVASYSYNFDTLLWQTPMLRPHEYVQPQIYINNICNSLDSSGFVVLGSLTFYEEGSTVYGKGLAFKVSPDGDSLWAREYISSAYDAPDSLYYWRLRMISPTPYGYVITGMTSDRHERRYRSILLHVDKEGCLVPGCDEIVNTLDVESGLELPFKIFPNPINEQFYILSRITSTDRHAVLLYDMNGREVHKSYITPEEGGQYIVFLPTVLTSGIYVVNLVDESGQIVFADNLVKE